MNKFNLSILTTLFLSACGSTASYVTDETVYDVEESVSEDASVAEQSVDDQMSEICEAERYSFFTQNIEKIRATDMVHKTFDMPQGAPETEFGELHLTYCILSATQELYSEFRGCQAGKIEGDDSVMCELAVTDETEEITLNLVVTNRKTYGECSAIFDVYLVADGEVEKIGTSYYLSPHDENPQPSHYFKTESSTDEYILCTWSPTKTTAYRANTPENYTNGYHTSADHNNSNNTAD